MSNLSRLPLPSRFRGGQTTAGFSLSPRTVGRSGSIVFACVYVGKALDISGCRPRETQFLGACSALAWSTVAGRRYLGSFTPNVETECWHNFRRRRWRAQLTPFHASATSLSHSFPALYTVFRIKWEERRKKNFKPLLERESLAKSYIEINFRCNSNRGESAKIKLYLRVDRTDKNYYYPVSFVFLILF